MPTIQRCKRVRFTAQQMYQLVNDVMRYPDFIPYCAAANIHDASPESMTASLTISMKGGLQQSFTTCNRLVAHQSIEMNLAAGPFKSLHGFWRFQPVDSHSSDISLDLSFDFKNKLTQLALSPVFSQVIHSMMDAFIQRAEVVYGAA